MFLCSSLRYVPRFCHFSHQLISEQFYTALSPLGVDGVGTAEDFFKSYLALPVVMAFWVAGYFWKGKGWLKTSEIDVDTDRRPVNWDLINATRAEIAGYPAWKRVYYYLF